MFTPETPIPELTGPRLHHRLDGPGNGPALVFANALGTDLTLWDAVVAHLPDSLRILRYDMRGHGQSPAPEGPYYMGDLVGDAARLMDKTGLKDAVFVGLSLGGMVAQGLAAERLDLLRGLVLSHTAAKIATPSVWQKRIDAVRVGGIEAEADATMERWFARSTRTERPELVAEIRAMVTGQPTQGYLGAMAAIAETDLIDSTASLRLPTLGIAGSEDGSTPADLVRETAERIPGARFELLRRTGHMSPVEDPESYARVLTDFLKSIGHL